MITKLNRNSAYFQSLRDRNMTISTKDMDANFNEIVRYINSNTLPTIDILAGKELVGVAGLDNAFLRNVGDGSVVFDSLRTIDIPDNTIALDKIEYQEPFGVVFSNINRELGVLTADQENKLLVSDDRSFPSWSKLTGQYFADASINTEKVAYRTLTVEHLIEGIIGKPLEDEVIQNIHVQDNTIQNSKLGEDVFDSSKISAELMATRVPVDLLVFPEKSITSRNIRSNSVNVKNTFFYEQNAGYPITGLKAILSPDSIALNSVQIEKTNSPHTEITFDVRKQFDGSIVPSKVRDQSLYLPPIRTSFNGWPGIETNLKLSKNNLSPELRAILVEKGGLKA